NQGDEENRDQKRLFHLLDRKLNEFGRIVSDDISNAVGKGAAQLLHGTLDGGGGCQRIGAGTLSDDERRRDIVVEIGVEGVILRAKLDAKTTLMESCPSPVDWELI